MVARLPRSGGREIAGSTDAQRGAAPARWFDDMTLAPAGVNTPVHLP